MSFRRHGDVNFFPITKEKFEKVNGKIVKHNGSYIVARGEATGSTHNVTVKDPKDMIIKETENGERYIALFQEALISHTHDHKTLEMPVTYYQQVQEREIDNFGQFTVRQVVD